MLATWHPLGSSRASSGNNTAWANAFAEEVVHLRSRGVTYVESSNFLRTIIRNSKLRFTDIRDDPKKFFLAHRLLAQHAPAHGPGFWIRFTVQFNLFAGTVVALGGSGHLKLLDEIQRDGELGCFCLTEKLAGVNSGLVVNTTAHYDSRKQKFILNSPTEGSKKNWISQGLTAEWAVVVADLAMDGERLGPHGFLVRMRDSSPQKNLLPGVVVGDMGEKTTGTDLDNAWVKFDNYEVPRESLLDKYGGVGSDNVYKKKTKNAPKPMEMIGQRLLTGRVAVAQAALVFSKKLYANTREYSDSKMCAMRGDTPYLTDVPQLKALYEEAEMRFKTLDAFVDGCEENLCKYLVAGSVPAYELTRAIAVAKIKSVETCVELCHRLKQEVGSYALMSGTGFEHTDFLQCCKFAEGDSRILSQKIARDAYGEFGRAKRKGLESVPGWSAKEMQACTAVHLAVASATGKGLSKIQAWDGAWRQVYALAESVCERVMSEAFEGSKTLSAKL